MVRVRRDLLFLVLSSLATIGASSEQGADWPPSRSHGDEGGLGPSSGDGGGPRVSLHEGPVDDGQGESLYERFLRRRHKRRHKKKQKTTGTSLWYHWIRQDATPSSASPSTRPPTRPPAGGPTRPPTGGSGPTAPPRPTRPPTRQPTSSVSPSQDATAHG